MKICWLFLFFIMQNVFAIDVLLRKNHSDKKIVHIDVYLDPGEILYKDSIRISSDDDFLIKEWTTFPQAVKEYIASLKMHKKVYRDSFSIKVALNKTAKTLLYLACFVIDRNEVIRPYLKKLSIGEEIRKKGEKTRKKKKRQKVYIQNKNDEGGLSYINSTMVFFALVLLLFILFVFINVLLLSDIMILLFLGGWFYFIPRFFNYEIMLLGLSVFLTMAALWFLKNYNVRNSFLRITRIILGMLCASLVLPIIIETYLARKISGRSTSIIRTNDRPGKSLSKKAKKTMTSICDG